jgi:hypothetical protein
MSGLFLKEDNQAGRCNNLRLGRLGSDLRVPALAIRLLVRRF